MYKNDHESHSKEVKNVDRINVQNLSWDNEETSLYIFYTSVQFRTELNNPS